MTVKQLQAFPVHSASLVTTTPSADGLLCMLKCTSFNFFDLSPPIHPLSLGHATYNATK